MAQRSPDTQDDPQLQNITDLFTELRMDIQEELRVLFDRLVHEMQLRLAQKSDSPLGQSLLTRGSDSPLGQNLLTRGPNSPCIERQRSPGKVSFENGDEDLEDLDSPLSNVDSSLRRAMESEASSHAYAAQQFQTFNSTVVQKIVDDLEHKQSDVYTRFQDQINEYRLRELEKEHADMSEIRGRVIRFVLGQPFGFFSFFMIVANAVWMGHESDYGIEAVGKSQTAWRHYVGLGFLSFFLFEVLVKMAALSRQFFFGAEWKWNVLDILLVTFSLPEFFVIDSSGGNVSFLRLIRVFKLTKAFRLVRVMRFFGALREILLSFMYTLGSLFWSFACVILVTYMFALFFMQALAALLENEELPSDIVIDGFPTTLSAMVTLFSMITGGQDWYPFMQGIIGDSFTAGLARNGFLFYVFVMLFGFVNVILGVFCARASEATASDAELRAARGEQKYGNILRQSARVFSEIDVTKKGYVTWEQFQDYFMDAKPNTLRSMPALNSLQFFEMGKFWQVMTLYSRGEEGTVDLPGFVMAVLRLSGEASSTEVVMVSIELKRMSSRLDEALKNIEKHGSRQTVPRVVASL